MKPTYVALTTLNAEMSVWNIVTLGLAGESREIVRERAEAIIVGCQIDRPKDILVDTELKNLRVLPKSKVSPKLIENYEVDRYEEEAYRAAADEAEEEEANATP